MLVLAGLFGASLLYGDSMITPGHLRAERGGGAQGGDAAARAVRHPHHHRHPGGAVRRAEPRARRGSGGCSGPVTLLWFLTLGLLGLGQIVRSPGVLAAVNPLYAVSFFAQNGWSGFLVLGSVFLAVTGGEALYADMGHFGARPIRFTWFTVVLPALLLNYFGQGALILRDPSRHRAPVLSHGAGVGAVPAGGALHRGDGHRVAGGDLGRVLAHAAGGAAGLPAAPAHRAHVGAADRADLHPQRELAADARLHRAGDRLPQLQQPGVGVRRGGDDGHGVHHASCSRSWRAAGSAGPSGRWGCWRRPSWWWTWASGAPTWSRFPTAAGSRW